MSWQDIKATADWMAVTRFVLSLIIVLGFFGIAVIVLYADASELGQAGMMILGGLQIAFGSVVNYYIGSSSGSASKDKFLKGIK